MCKYNLTPWIWIDYCTCLLLQHFEIHCRAFPKARSWKGDCWSSYRGMNIITGMLHFSENNTSFWSDWSQLEFFKFKKSNKNIWLNIKICRTASFLNFVESFLFAVLRMMEVWSDTFPKMFYFSFSVSWPRHFCVASTNALYLPLVWDCCGKDQHVFYFSLAFLEFCVIYITKHDERYVRISSAFYTATWLLVLFRRR